MYSETLRPLTAREIKKLKLTRSRLDQRDREMPKNLTGCFGILALLSLIPAVFRTVGPSSVAASAILLGLFSSMALFIFLTGKRELGVQRAKIERVIAYGTARERHIQSSRCFMIEPEDDEGYAYYFEVGENETFLLLDSEDLISKLPNDDITVVSVLDPDGRVFEEWLTTNGKRLNPFVTFQSRDVVDFGSYDERLLRSGKLEDRMRELGLKIHERSVVFYYVLISHFLLGLWSFKA